MMRRFRSLTESDLGSIVPAEGEASFLGFGAAAVGRASAPTSIAMRSLPRFMRSNVTLAEDCGEKFVAGGRGEFAKARRERRAVKEKQEPDSSSRVLRRFAPLRMLTRRGAIASGCTGETRVAPAYFVKKLLIE